MLTLKQVQGVQHPPIAIKTIAYPDLLSGQVWGFRNEFGMTRGAFF
jgi:hypothetical protein